MTIILLLQLRRFRNLSEPLRMKRGEKLLGSLSEFRDLDLESCPLYRVAELIKVDSALVRHRVEHIIVLD